MFSLRLLGGVSLDGPLGPLSGRIVAPHSLAILSVLCAAGPKGISREKIIGYFWGDRGETAARHLLSNALYVIHKSLGEDAVGTSGNYLRIDPELVWSDLRAFEQALEQDDLTRAISFYEGPFLDGFYLSGPGATEFEHWVEPRRQGLAHAYAAAVERLAQEAHEAGDHLAAVSSWEQLLEQDPYNVRFAVRLVEAFALARDPANGLRFADEFEQRFIEDLGLEPDPQLQAAADRLRQAPLEAGTLPARRTSETAAEVASKPGRSPALTAVHRSGGRATSFAVGAAILLASGLVVRWIATGSGDLASTVEFSSGDGVGPAELDLAHVPARERLILADFEDLRNSGLGSLVTEALRIDLAQSSQFALLDSERLKRALRRMQRNPAGPLDLASARVVALREGIPVVISGAIIGSNDRYELAARVVAATSGENLLEVRQTASDSADLIRAIGRLSWSLRERMGESLQDIERSEPLPKVTTSSLTALRLYADGVRLQWEGYPIRAREALEEAIGIDPMFAMAYVSLAEWAPSSWQQIETIRKAYALREHLTQRERLLISASHAFGVRRDVDDALRWYRELVREYPDDATAINELADLYHMTGDCERGLYYFRRALSLDSTHVRGYFNATMLLLHLERLDEARATQERMATWLPDHPWTLIAAANISQATGDFDVARALLDNLLRRPSLDFWERARVLRRRAALSRLRGKLFAAEQHLLDAVAERADRRRIRGGCLRDIAAIALSDVIVRRDEARALARLESALERCPLQRLDPLDRPFAVLAQVYAAVGKAEHARDLILDYEQISRPKDRPWSDRLDLRLAQAELALAEARPRDALRLGRILERQKMCPWNLCTSNAQILRARAFDQTGQVDSALASYESFANAPGLIHLWPQSYWLPVAYERLARLHAEKGAAEDARKYLTLFIHLWKDADPELQPRVQEARQRLAKLNSEGTR